MSIVNNLFSSVEKILQNNVVSNLQEGLATKSTSKLSQAGDVDIIDILLQSEDLSRSYSLMAQCTSIDIYESIMCPAVFCELSIADSIGLLQSFPILAEEYVKIIFKTPKNKGEPTQYLFRINKVMNKQVNESNKRITYKLQLVSPELLRNSSKLVTKRGEDNISSLVQEIITEELGTTKPYKVDDTKGIEKVLITRLEPFKAIDWLRQRAVSPKYLSSSFCFFENKNGFRFTTIEKLIEDGVKSLNKGSSNKIFFYDTSRKDSIENVTIRNIIAYNQLTFGDTISQVAEGGFQNQIQEFDIITGDIRKVTYTDNLGADKFVPMSDTSAGFNTSTFTKNNAKKTTITKIIPIRTDKPKTELSEKLSNLQAYTQKLVQNITQILVFGDTDITIGDMIQCQLPSGIDAKDGEGISRLDSGNYLVSKVRHMILLGDRPQHTMSLELIKSDLQTAL